MLPGQGHWIKPNHANRIPHRHVILDSESRTDGGRRIERQSWRLAVATYMYYTNHGHWHSETREYTDSAALWHDITAFTRPKKRTVIWAHNISYDLRVTNALYHLESEGWSLDDIRLNSRGTWGRWRNAGRSLVAVDSSSVWPCSLDALGATLGIGKLPLPDAEDDAGWMARCYRDVEILSHAVRLYLDWLKDADMGNWNVTGAGQSFAAWRHKFMTHQVLVADDLEARDAERRAMWTGRCEAWSTGENPKARVYDYDWQNAYPRICRDVDLPVKQVGTMGVTDLEHLIRLADKYCVLAEVDVTTSVPVVPTEHNGYMVWPVGTFKTTLWDPELRLLKEAGAEVKATRVWLYRKVPALKEWAEWILHELHAPDAHTPAWRKIILKHWSRTTIGRFAMRYRGWEEMGTSEVSDFALTTGLDGDTGEEITYMQVGHTVYEPGEETDSRDAVPAITGYVMSEARRRLWRAAEIVGHEHILYVDTDSLLLTHRGHRIMQGQAGNPELDGLRLKRSFTGWAIAGPRQVVIGGEPRISGVPRKSERTGPWTFTGHVWRSLGQSIRHGESDHVMIKARTFQVRCVDNRRVHDGTERTKPISILGQPSGRQSQEGASPLGSGR